MDTPPPPEKPAPPKRHRLRTTLIILIVVFVIVPLAVLGWTGIYHIPVVSALMGSSHPIDLGVHPTAADLAQAEADNPMQIATTPGQFRWSDNKTFSGTVSIDDVHSSAEMTAFIKQYHGNGAKTRDIQVKFHAGGMELSAFVVPYINAPVYADIDVARTSATTVSVSLKKAKVGRLTVPASYYDEIERAAQRIINQEIARIPGFSIETLEYRDGSAYFKGTLPATVGQAEGSRSVESIID